VSGRIEVGYAADLVAVDRDVLGGDGAELGATRVTRTYADGRLVFARD
jgi:predicted amidohydrolase YtcJ